MKLFRMAFLVAALAATPLFAQNEEGPGQAQGAAVDTTGKGYTAAYVIETSTGQVLHAENEHQSLPTASMAKMMTLLLAMEEIRAGNLKYETPVTISARASKMGGSQIYLRAGSVWPVKNLIIAAKVQTANDACTALAEACRRRDALRVDRMKQVFFLQHAGTRDARVARRRMLASLFRTRVATVAGGVAAWPGLAFFSPGLLTAEKTVIRFRPADATCRRE